MPKTMTVLFHTAKVDEWLALSKAIGGSDLAPDGMFALNSPFGSATTAMISLGIRLVNRQFDRDV